MGSLLSIKPIAVIRDGVPIPFSKARTNEQVLSIMTTEIGKKLSKYPEAKINVILSGIFVDEWLKEVEDVMRSKFNIQNLWYGRLSVSTAVHAGPKYWSMTYCIV